MLRRAFLAAGRLLCAGGALLDRWGRGTEGVVDAIDWMTGAPRKDEEELPEEAPAPVVGAARLTPEAQSMLAEGTPLTSRTGAPAAEPLEGSVEWRRRELARARGEA